MCWNDNNVVTAASNCHGVHPLGKATRFSKAKGGKMAIDVPQLIKQYNTFMGGVDRFDQNVACYRCNIRSKKMVVSIFCVRFGSSHAKCLSALSSKETRLWRCLGLAWLSSLCRSDVPKEIWKSSRVGQAKHTHKDGQTSSSRCALRRPRALAIRKCHSAPMWAVWRKSQSLLHEV